MKNQNGITLIALVITIIVLLILAGVAIAMLSGENGILKQATNATVQTAISSAKEQIGLEVNEAITNYYDKVYVDGDNATQTAGIQAAVVTALSNFSEDLDDVTYEKPATNDDGTVTATIKITYTSETKYSSVGTIDANGKLTWEDSEDLKNL